MISNMQYTVYIYYDTQQLAREQGIEGDEEWQSIDKDYIISRIQLGTYVTPQKHWNKNYTLFAFYIRLLI